jgi:hypothetical protein
MELPRWIRRMEAAARLPAATRRQKDAARYWGNLYRATPPWLTKEQKRQIRRIYRDARERGLVVDHIVPLAGRIVCGLHVPWNLRATTAELNYAKSATWWPGCPYEQLTLGFSPVTPPCDATEPMDSVIVRSCGQRAHTFGNERSP